MVASRFAKDALVRLSLPSVDFHQREFCKNSESQDGMTFEPECLETETPKAFPSASFQREFLFVPFQSDMTVATLGLSTKWREYMMELVCTALIRGLGSTKKFNGVQQIVGVMPLKKFPSKWVFKDSMTSKTATT